MAEQLKDIRNRVRSVKSTKQITKTMELVATSKMKRAQERVAAAAPYNDKLQELLSEIAAKGSSFNDPLLTEREKVKRVNVLLICANRGLCGGYNANSIKLAKGLVDQQIADGREVDFDIVGKKGISTLKFQGYELKRTYIDISDKPSLADAQKIVAPMREAFLKGETDEVHVVWTHWVSVGRQDTSSFRLLPITPPKNEDKPKSGDMILDPSPEELLSSLLPMYLTQSIYTCLVEANASEQVARRTAMKSATDNAEEMITNLTRRLNRARQAKITQEIAEVVGGAAALE